MFRHNSKYSLQQMEEKVWASIQDYIKTGGKIRDGHFGLALGKDYSVKEYKIHSSDKRARCGLSCLIDTDKATKHLQSLYNGQSYNHSWVADTFWFNMIGGILDIKEEQVEAFVLGFDGHKDISVSVNTSIFNYWKLGSKIRRKAQQLPQWIGSKH